MEPVAARGCVKLHALTDCPPLRSNVRNGGVGAGSRCDCNSDNSEGLCVAAG